MYVCIQHLDNIWIKYAYVTACVDILPIGCHQIHHLWFSGDASVQDVGGNI